MNARVIELVTDTRAELVQRRRNSACLTWWDALDEVKDPEIPVLSIWDLGILQNVEEVAAKQLEVTITPTYSGCPAMELIERQIVEALTMAGAEQVCVNTQLAPPWSSEWMDAEARKRLNGYGIAPPGSTRCPHCNSTNTEVVSEFGSTACKSLYRCLDCQEPFDHFKSF